MIYEQVIGAGMAMAQGSRDYSNNIPGAPSVQGQEVPRELDRLQEALKMLDAQVQQLEDRLMPVVRQEAVNSTKEPSPHAVPNTHYGSRLQEAQSHIGGMYNRLASLMARLEV